MGSRIVPIEEPVRQRQPRERDNKHLAFIRRLPCLVCCVTSNIHAAHIRTAAIQYGKRDVGFGEKPDDRWTVPLCADHHVFGPNAQHMHQEIRWFRERRINPFVTALALWACSGDDERGIAIAQMADSPHN